MPRWLTVNRVLGALVFVAGIGFVGPFVLPGELVPDCGLCASCPTYNVFSLAVLSLYFLFVSVVAVATGSIVFLLQESDVPLWLTYPPGLPLVFLTAVVAAFYTRMGLSPDLPPKAALAGASVLAIAPPIARGWRPRVGAALAAVGSGVVAAAAYPPVVGKLPFTPSGENLFRALMELSILGHPYVMGALAVFAALAAAGLPRRVCVGLAALPAATLAYVVDRFRVLLGPAIRYSSFAAMFTGYLLLIEVSAAAAAAVFIALAVLGSGRR